MDRDAFLAHLRSCLAGADAPPAPAAPSTARPTVSREERVERFVRGVAAAGGRPRRVATPAAAHEAVLEIVREVGARKVIRGTTGLLAEIGAELDRRLAADGVEVGVAFLGEERSRETLRAAAFAADVGLTAAEHGLASTGTLALLAGPGQGRAVSLLPPVHVAVIRADDLVADLAELLARVDADGGPPSALTFVTGPSKTGDIELVLTVGVHGPGELHVVVVG